RAVPMFHGLGMTQQPVWCSARNVRRFSAILMRRSREAVCGGDNASNPQAIAIWSLGVRPRAGRNKHPNRLDIPTLSCDRDDAAFTFRVCVDSLCDWLTRNANEARHVSIQIVIASVQAA